MKNDSNGKERRNRQVSFRVTGWYADRLEELCAYDRPEGEPPRKTSAVIREAIALLWEQRCASTSMSRRRLADKHHHPAEGSLMVSEISIVSE